MLQSINIIRSDKRISSVDIFRCTAIILVMLFHFDLLLPFGNIGVDLFFVISGLLVGGILVDKISGGEKVNFFRFILQRGFKIWPSYYLYIFLGFYLKGVDMSFEHLSKYIFFYQNYTGESSHVWSLCIEEHFYILLPILFIALSYFRRKNQPNLMRFMIWGLIISGIVFKFLSYYYTNSQDTYSGTHNRLDGLAWGVLLCIQVRNEVKKNNYILFWLGFILMAASILLAREWFFFYKVLYNSIIPFSFYLMMRGIYYMDFSRQTVMRLIAYYSYNIFLWHDLISVIALDNFGNGIWSFSFYVVVSLATGFLLTILVEEPFLRMRKYVVAGIFDNRKPTIS